MLYFEVNPDERESRLSFANLGKNLRFSTFTQQKNQIVNRFSLSSHCSSYDKGEVRGGIEESHYTHEKY